MYYPLASIKFFGLLTKSHYKIILANKLIKTLQQPYKISWPNKKRMDHLNHEAHGNI